MCKVQGIVLDTKLKQKQYNKNCSVITFYMFSYFLLTSSAYVKTVKRLILHVLAEICVSYQPYIFIL